MAPCRPVNTPTTGKSVYGLSTKRELRATIWLHCGEASTIGSGFGSFEFKPIEAALNKWLQSSSLMLKKSEGIVICRNVYVDKTKAVFH